MSQLALVAMLLLAALPTAGRLATALAAGAEGRWVELCTVAGRTLAFVDAQGRISDGDDAPADVPAHPHDGDPAATECGYCPLLGGLATDWPRMAPAFARTTRDVERPSATPAPTPVVLPGGPGARGPPHALRTA